MKVTRLSALCLLLTSCVKSTAPIVTTFSSVNQTNSQFSYQLFQVDHLSKESAYIGTLQSNPSGFEWPSTLTQYFNQISAGPVQVQYFVKAFGPTGAGLNGDFYFESPVVSQALALNGPSTGLWYALRSASARDVQPTMLSNSVWQNLLFEINSVCPTCLDQSGSVTYRLIAQSPSLQTSLNQVFTSYSLPVVSFASLSTPTLGVAYSSPPLVNGLANLASAQGLKQTVQLIFFDPAQLNTPVYPNQWNVLIPSAMTTTPISPLSDPSTVQYTFDLTNLGEEVISASQSAYSTPPAQFVFQVAYTPYPPILSVPRLTFTANHDSTYDLTSYATDPHSEALTFSLLAAPTGVTLNGNVLEWNPTQEPVSQVGNNSVGITITNTDNLSTFQFVPCTVIADQYPQFSAPFSTWNLSEGTLGQYSFQVFDSDNDPVELQCVTGCSTLKSGSPLGAGWPILTYPNSSIYTLLGGGVETVTLSYMPSYLQTIGSNLLTSLLLSVNYPASATNLRPVYAPSLQTLVLNITNVADPPVWQVQPTTNPIPNPSEVSPMNLAGGQAIIPAVNPPSDNTITYSIVNLAGSPGTAANCSWINLSPATAVSSGTVLSMLGTPPYTSAGNCSYNVRATDSLGLFTDSNLVNLPITNVPRPVTAQGSISAKTAYENVQFTLDFTPYFNDPDFSQNDPREALTYTCLNCATLGIPTTGPFGLGFSGNVLQWTPAFTIAPTGGSTLFSGIQIQVTNTGNFSAVQSFNLTVFDNPAPMVVSFSTGSLIVNSTVVSGAPSYAANITAGQTGTVVLTVANPSGDFSAYPYTLTTTCVPACSSSMVSLNSYTGVAPGTTTYTLSLAPTYSDGYGGAAVSTNSIAVSVMATDNSNTAIVGKSTLNVGVGTVDRPLSAFIISGDVNTGTYLYSIDGFRPQPNILTFAVSGYDASNDSFIYTSSMPAFGSISGNTWSFNPLASGCNNGSSTVVKTITFHATSSHGQVISRDVQITVTNTATGSGCPY